VKLIDQFRAAERGYLGRHEARMACRRGHIAFYYGLAGLADLAALMAVLLLTVPGFGREVGIVVAVATLATVALLPVASAVGLLIPAMAGEKADGTLEALMLTPVSRREILWAKLVGRMRPVRCFLAAAAPAYALCGLTPALAAAAQASDPGEAAGIAILGGFAGLLVAALLWLAVLADSHCAAAVTLYCSAWAGSPIKATMIAAFAVLAPPVVLSCCYGLGLPYHFIAGPVMFSELVRNLDRFTIEQP
jgi:ABC-type transport system involved in multi-copper enzyme maturation permease subunit